MGADTKTLRSRIRSVDATLHLVKAAGLVASSKLPRALERMQAGRTYEEALRQGLTPLLTTAECQASPYMRQRESGIGCTVLMGGDRGLAGGYNAQLFRVADREGGNIIPLGKHACMRYGAEIRPLEGLDHSNALGIAMELCRGFAEGIFARVEVLYTSYRSAISRDILRIPLLPLEIPAKKHRQAYVIPEPDALTVFHAVVPELLAGILLRAARESTASEMAARRVAMDTAEKNARQMLDDLRLDYHQARQSAITREITEIVAGSGAYK